MGEPVLVYTGVKPPAPGTQQAGWGEPKPKGKKTATAKLTSSKDAKDKAGKDKDAAKDSAKDKDTAATGTSDGPAPKPKPKKPKNAPTSITPAQQTSQAR
jgi:hypothetical protein